MMQKLKSLIRKAMAGIYGFPLCFGVKSQSEDYEVR